MPANSNYQRPRKSQSTSRRTTNREGMPYPSNSTMMMTNPLPVGGFIGPVTPPSDVISPDVRAMNSGSLIASSAIRHVRRVSKQAAMNTKKQIWDSNDASIVAAQSAVDQWEAGYNGLRNLLCAVGNSAQGLYGAAKAGVSGLEHGFLLPVRDWVLLPAFGGVEKLTGETIGFLQSPHAQHLAHQSLGLARQVPFVGENILAPSLCIGANVLKKTWEIAQYPIPTRSQVRDSVDFVMTGTKVRFFLRIQVVWRIMNVLSKLTSLAMSNIVGLDDCWTGSQSLHYACRCEHYPDLESYEMEGIGIWTVCDTG